MTRTRQRTNAPAATPPDGAPDGVTDGRGLWPPRLFLLLCAPVVVDLLFGAVQLSTLAALVPTVLTYGCAALLVQSAARRYGAGRPLPWPAVAVWGLAFAVAAECLIVQTSLDPAGGDDAGWGRALGVNWPYLTWASGYEAGWAIALGIQLTGLVFPCSRTRPWLTRRGLWAVGAVFTVGAVRASYHWTHSVAPRLHHRPVYHPAPGLLVAAAVAVGGLLLLGRFLATHRPAPRVESRTRRTLRRGTTRRTMRPPGSRPHAVTPPHPAVVALGACAAAALWFALLSPSTDPALIRLPAAAAIAAALVVAAAALGLLRGWSRHRRWSDRHRIAVLAGMLAASTAAGFFANDFAGPGDFAGKAGLDAAALAGLALLYRRRPVTTAD